MKKKLLYSVVFLSVIFASCKYFTRFDNYLEFIEFKSNKYSIAVGDCEVCYVTASPADSFDYYECSFDTDEKNIIEIIDKEDNYCIIKGIGEGSVVLTASMGNKKCKCVVRVR